MRMVREGDMNYKLALNSSFGVSSDVPLQSSNPLRQSKTSVIVFISLCARAAIEGGLSPEQAYSLGNSYIQSVESAKTISEISAISNAMYEDFITRVHNCRTNPALSKQIQACCDYCDYIELNIEEDFGISDLAARAGSSPASSRRKPGFPSTTTSISPRLSGQSCCSPSPAWASRRSPTGCTSAPAAISARPSGSSPAPPRPNTAANTKRDSPFISSGEAPTSPLSLFWGLLRLRGFPHFVYLRLHLYHLLRGQRVELHGDYGA